jgi:hypothetical protein
MERRRFYRIPVKLKANIICGGKTYAGFIKNVSESGLGYLITSVVETPEDFKLKKIVQVSFQVPSDEMLNLKCEIIWFLRTPFDDKTLTLGMKIIDPPPEYKEFVKNLYVGKIVYLRP